MSDSPVSAHGVAARDDALTNDEIETLYEIIRHAQTLPGPPLRTLFSAYDHLKRDESVQDEGEKLLGFLLRMVEDDGVERRHGRRAAEGREHEEVGLMERFRRVLGRMGIEVEVEDEETEAVEEGQGISGGVAEARAREEETGGRRRERTGSFDSFLDGGTDKIAGDLPFRSRRGSVAASDMGRWQKRRSTSVEGAGSRVQGLPIRTLGTRGQGDRRIVSDSMRSRPRRSASVSSRASLRIYRDGETGTQRLEGYDGDGDDSDQTDSFDRSNIQIPGVNAPLPGAPPGLEHNYAALYRPSDTQIVRDAETFDYHRVLAQARTHLQNWRDLARDARDQREQMQAQAAAFDRNVLLKASISDWRAALEGRRQAKETERFFSRLEARASKARNLFLLTKAFTHWAKSAEDEVQRTSTARRHILRTRYFNAWRDVTAVNELKVQHFILAKFLDKWRARTAAVLEQNDMAVSLHEHNIVYRLYWQWFWRFADRRAPFLWRNRLVRATIAKWAEIVQILKEREAWAADQRERTIARSSFAKLSANFSKVRAMEDQASQFRRTALLSSAFTTLRRHTRFTPLETQIKSRINTRLLRSSLQTWHRTALLSRQAKQVDRQRILQSAFTTWNDRLRIKAVSDRINDRVQLEALYKWALASRVSLLQRVQNHRVKQSFFNLWIQKTRAQSQTLESAERRFQALKRAKLLRSALGKIESATVERKNREYLALSVYEPKVKQRMLDALLDKHEHVQRMQGWATRADYYVTAKGALKKWQAASTNARRNRRREAYVTMRRTVKIHLVRRMFGVWRDRSFTIRGNEERADSFLEGRVRGVGQELLWHWHARFTSLQGLAGQAESVYTSKITTFAFDKLSAKIEDLRDLDAQAMMLRQESTDIVAAGCLKKMGWRVWNVRRREEDAAALRKRFFGAHVRKMVRFWAEQVRERRELEGVEAGEVEAEDEDGQEEQGGHDEGGGDGDGEGILDDAGDETRRLESWTAFDETGLHGFRGLEASNLDLSFSVTPERRPLHGQAQGQGQREREREREGEEERRREPPSSISRRAPPRPRTRTQYPPSSILRRTPHPPLTIQEEPSHEEQDEPEDFLSDTFHNDPTFLSSTPAAPPPLPSAPSFAAPRLASPSRTRHQKPPPPSQPQPQPTYYPPPPQNNPLSQSLALKPGYLKTPSKRSVARAKRFAPGLGPGPGLSNVNVNVSPERGIRSAPVVRARAGEGRGGLGGGGSGVTSFERRLREGGY